jgi:hypothetical protein
VELDLSNRGVNTECVCGVGGEEETNMAKTKEFCPEKSGENIERQGARVWN